jgi:hypothetical protein
MGQPLYEKHGFIKVDEIERWLLRENAGSASVKVTATQTESDLRLADQQAWGENRESLLNCLVRQGKSFACDETVALLQQENDMQVIGPWYSPQQCPRANRVVLQKLLAHAQPGSCIVADVLSSSPVGQLLAAANFTCVGKNALMVKGGAGDINLTSMVSLASLGSIG